MNFTVIDKSSTTTEEMYPGQIIQYRVSPILGIPLNWVTEITHVADKSYFVDEQRFGPYSFWHHQHFIKAVKGGVEMVDIVHYKLPFGLIGKLLNMLFVKNQLKQIFDYRFKKIETIFHK
ncbi:MAG: SRPBCC family protein [Bacteroidota bacterium]